MRESKLVRKVAVELFGEEVGCGASGCVFGSRGGMCTNAGCRCLSPSHRNPHELAQNGRQLAKIAHELARLLS